MSVIEALLKYQDIDLEISDMNIEIWKSKEGQEKLTLKKEGMQIMENLVKVDKLCANSIKEYEELEKELNKLNQELEEYDGIENDLNSKEQSEYCLNKIKELIAKIEAVSKQIAESNNRMDKNLKFADKLRESYSKNNADTLVANEKLKEFREPYVAKVNDLMAEMKKLEEIIGEELVEKYKNLRKRYPTKKVFVELVGDDKKGWMCTGCFLESTAADVKMKEAGKELVECQSCGRLVYKKK